MTEPTEQDLINEKAIAALMNFIFNDPAMQGQDFIDFKQSAEYSRNTIMNWLFVTGLDGVVHPVSVFEKVMA